MGEQLYYIGLQSIDVWCNDFFFALVDLCRFVLVKHSVWLMSIHGANTSSFELRVYSFIKVFLAYVRIPAV